MTSTSLIPANELQRLKDTFLASLNHEIRTPLSGFLGMLELLRETELDEEQLDYVTTAKACADALLEILNTTLEYTALEAGHLKLDESEFRLAAVLETVVAQYLSKAEAKGLTLRA